VGENPFDRGKSSRSEEECAQLGEVSFEPRISAKAVEFGLSGCGVQPTECFCEAALKLELKRELMESLEISRVRQLARAGLKSYEPVAHFSWSLCNRKFIG
jgi:hypothetical protein